MNWYFEVLKKYAEFNGRARRMEYWMFFLFNCIIASVLWAGSMFLLHRGMWLYMLYSLAVLIPGIAVSVRRLHDTNKSGWWLLISLIPFVGAIILLVFFFMDSQPGDNQYGPNPKAPGSVPSVG